MSWTGAARFYHQLAVILRTDLPIAKAVTLSGPVAEGFHARNAQRWSLGCEAGAPLWQQLEASGEDPLAVALVRAGEQSGRLPELADRLAVHYEHYNTLLWNFIGKAVYPVILLHCALVVPALPGVVLGSKPAIALLYGPAALWTLIAVGAVAALAMRRSGMLARVMLMPGPHLLVRPLLTSMTCEVMGAAFAAGMLMPAALELAAGAVGNRVWSGRLHEVAERARVGSVPGVGAALTEIGFARDHIAILASAETAGRIDQALAQVATIAEEAFRMRTEWAVRILNGTVYTIAALMVAWVVISGAQAYVQQIQSVSEDDNK